MKSFKSLFPDYPTLCIRLVCDPHGCKMGTYHNKSQTLFFFFFLFVASDYIWLYPISEIQYGVMDYSDAIAFVRILAGLTVRFASINCFICCLQLYSSASRPCASVLAFRPHSSASKEFILFAFLSFFFFESASQ